MATQNYLINAMLITSALYLSGCVASDEDSSSNEQNVGNSNDSVETVTPNTDYIDYSNQDSININGNANIGDTDNSNTDNSNTDNADDETTAQCNSQISAGYQTLRLLTRDQYQRSVEDLLAVDFDITKKLPADSESGSFTNNNNLSVLDSSYTSYITVAEQVAKFSADRNFQPALQCNSFDDACATRLIDDFAWKIFRRPLTNNERQSYLSLAKGSATDGDIKAGMELALASLLSSPQFIYRHEIGELNQDLGSDIFELSDYEVATFISFSFSGTTPDDELLQAAKSNQLSTNSQIQAQVSRLLDSSTSQLLMSNLVHRWLDTEGLDNQQKDLSLYPNFDQLSGHMKNELGQMFSHVMLDKNESYQSLYNADYSFINGPLAEHYGISGISGNNLQKVATQDRGGLLLSGAFLSRWAHNDESNGITRAVHIRRDLLCQDIPEPPSGVSLSLDDKKGELADFLDHPTTTQRMRFARLTEAPGCTQCHTEIINPLGFGLEDFDTAGVYRTTDMQGNTIDASGEFFQPSIKLEFYDNDDRNTQSTPFYGGKGIAELMANDAVVSSLAKSCLVTQMMSFTTGIDSRSIGYSEREDVPVLASEEKAAYNCDVQSLVNTLSSDSPRKMLEQMGSLDSIRYRKAWNR